MACSHGTSKTILSLASLVLEGKRIRLKSIGMEPDGETMSLFIHVDATLRTSLGVFCCPNQE